MTSTDATAAPASGPARGWYLCPTGRHRRRDKFTAGSSSCAPCAFEDARTQVRGVLAGLLPQHPDVVEAVVGATATSGDKTRVLLAWLSADADPLGRGDPHTPAVAQVLLRALQDAGIPVVLPRCVACGQHRRHLTKITSVGRVCMTCSQKQSAEPCSRCRRTAVVSTREDDGRPVCQRCRTNDPLTWRACGVCGRAARPVSVADGVVLGDCCYVPLAQRCTVCGVAKAVRRQSGRRSVCRRCRSVPVVDCASCGLDAPAGPAAHETATTSGPDTAVSQDVAAGVLCARCRGGGVSACQGCGTATVARAADGTPRCPDCYRRPEGICGRCGRTRAIARLATGGDPDLCAACWRGPVTECASCGRQRPCRGQRTGVMLCEGCRVGNPLPCSRCGRTRRVSAHWPDGPVCPTCYRYARVLHGPCPRCSKTTRLLRHTRGAPACAACLGVSEPGICGNCAQVEDNLPMRGRCTRCAVAVHLRQLLGPAGTDPAPEETPALTAWSATAREALRVVLAEAPSQSGVLDLLTRAASPARALLERLVSGRVECSHEALDALEQTGSLRWLRHLLVAAGILPDRDPVLAATITWAQDFLQYLPDPVGAQLLRCYLRWRLLPGLRARAETAPVPPTTGYAVRARLKHVAAFVDFLAARGRSLEACTQEDLEVWAVERPWTLGSLPSFWSWSARRGDMPGLCWPRRPPEEGTAVIPGPDQRWALARMLLHGEGVSAADRVAGCLVLIYGQRLARCVQLRVDDVLLGGGESKAAVRIRLGPTPIEVPEPLAGHLRDLLAEHRGPTTAALTSNWLFPSPSAAGRPRAAQALSKRLARLGLTPASHRAAALLDLAAQMPPAVLADVLGISIATAEHWAHLAGRDRACYLSLS